MLPAQEEEVAEAEETRVADAKCDHLNIKVEFDEEAAKGLSTYEIRSRWPRFYGECPDCGQRVIVYASRAHYLWGDW